MTADARALSSTLKDTLALAVRDLRSGDRSGAQAALERIVAAQPQNFEALHYLGLACAMSGNMERAETLIKQAISIKPDYAEALFNLGRVLHSCHKIDEALDCLGAAARLEPKSADVHFVRGMVLEDRGELEAAELSYNEAIALRPDFADAYTNRGVIEAKLNRLAEALASHDRAIALQPAFADAHGHRGDVLQRLNRLEEALASYDTAISLRPDCPPDHINRGGVLEKLRRYDDALAAYDRIVALEPASAQSHCHRARALYELNRIEEALAAYARALELEPGFAPAKNGIFAHHLGELRDLPLIEGLGVEVSEINLRQKFARPLVWNTIFGFRVVHDLEQASYLLARGHSDSWLRQAHRRLAELQSGRLSPGGGATQGATLIHLSDEVAGEVNLFRKALLRYQSAKPVKHCLNPANDWQAIEDQYLDSDPELVVIDNLLSPEALGELREFCLVSTVWKEDYQNHYLGAFANGGFLSPLHLRIALELKERMPRIFGSHRLEQLWGFKYDPEIHKGINPHADFAKVNLNFWITPDEANRDPHSGGLIVYTARSPSTWSFEEFNRDEAAIREFVRMNQSTGKKVPYRCNRAVLFNSALFHETDEIHFMEGYENRRINITYLFGKELRLS